MNSIFIWDFVASTVLEQPTPLKQEAVPAIRDCGFHVRIAEDQDVKRLLAVYYQQDVTTEHVDSFDEEGSGHNS